MCLNVMFTYIACLMLDDYQQIKEYVGGHGKFYARELVFF